MLQFTPVLRRPIVKPADWSVLARPTAGWSPSLPAGRTLKPMLMQPRKNVPVVKTTVLPNTSFPSPAMNILT